MNAYPAHLQQSAVHLISRCEARGARTIQFLLRMCCCDSVIELFLFSTTVSTYHYRWRLPDPTIVENRWQVTLCAMFQCSPKCCYSRNCAHIAHCARTYAGGEAHTGRLWERYENGKEGKKSKLQVKRVGFGANSVTYAHCFKKRMIPSDLSLILRNSGFNSGKEQFVPVEHFYIQRPCNVASSVGNGLNAYPKILHV